MKYQSNIFKKGRLDYHSFMFKTLMDHQKVEYDMDHYSMLEKSVMNGLAELV